MGIGKLPLIMYGYRETPFVLLMHGDREISLGVALRVQATPLGVAMLACTFGAFAYPHIPHMHSACIGLSQG